MRRGDTPRAAAVEAALAATASRRRRLRRMTIRARSLPTVTAHVAFVTRVSAVLGRTWVDAVSPLRGWADSAGELSALALSTPVPGVTGMSLSASRGGEGP